jgi:hypothetical protein
MSQISPPIRILLVCAVAFMAAWMLFLRPSSDAGTPAAETPPATTPVEAGGEKADSLAGKAVEQANEAAAGEDTRAQQLAAGTGESVATPRADATAPATAGATVTKTGAPANAQLPSEEQLADVPADVRRAFVKRQIVVLGVVSRKGADDRSVRKSLGKVDRLHGRVFVKTVPVGRISRYGTITRGSDLSQTPSVVIVDFGFKATTLAGWVDTRTIDQGVVDAIRASGQLYPDAYLRQVAEECSHTIPDIRKLEPSSGAEYSRSIAQYSSIVSQFGQNVAALDTPKKWRKFSRALRADVRHLAVTSGQWHAALGSNPTLAKAVGAYQRFGPEVEKTGKSLNKRFDAHDVLGCGSKS